MKTLHLSETLHNKLKIEAVKKNTTIQALVASFCYKALGVKT